MFLVDIHTHKPLAEGIEGIYNTRYPQTPVDTRFSIGIHPWDCETIEWDCHIETIASKAIAIGECGIDKCCNSDIAKQILLLEKHIQLAEKLHKPLIIHCVKAYGTILELNKKYSRHTPWLIHGCYGSVEWIKEASKYNIYFSVGPSQLKLKRFTEVLNAIPQERLLLETDDSEWNIGDVYKSVNVRTEDIWENYQRFISE